MKGSCFSLFIPSFWRYLKILFIFVGMEKFELNILGCGSALPTMRHSATSQVLNVREKLFMIDCGEGTQVQLRGSRLKFSRLNHVFISHLHGDHCFGLIGMISTFGMIERTADLHIYTLWSHIPWYRSVRTCRDIRWPFAYGRNHSIKTPNANLRISVSGKACTESYHQRYDRFLQGSGLYDKQNQERWRFCMRRRNSGPQ